MPKGFSTTILAIIVTILLLISLVGWVIYSNTSAPKVRGTSSVGEVIKPGFSVDVLSSKGTWDLYVFLCEDSDQCAETLDGGVRWLTRGGGQTSNSEVFVEAKDSWKKYEYIKVFVKPGWGSNDRKFLVTKEDVPLEIQMQEIDGVEVVLLPVNPLMSSFYKVAGFLD